MFWSVIHPCLARDDQVRYQFASPWNIGSFHGWVVTSCKFHGMEGRMEDGGGYAWCGSVLIQKVTQKITVYDTDI